MKAGVATLLAIKIGFDGLSLLAALVLARYLGPTQYGIFTLTTVWVTILAVPSRVGLDQVCTKVVSKSIECGDEV